jgi:hypothetical protein
MTNQIPDPDQNPLLSPRFDLNTANGLRDFMKWLIDPEVDKAFQQAFPLESEQDEN